LRGTKRKRKLMPRVGIEPTTIIAEILKKLLKTTQKTTHAKRQVVPNRENGIPIQPKPKAT
jgi:hypothetical protein